MAGERAVQDISSEWSRVCDEMDAARSRYCEAAKPVVAAGRADGRAPGGPVSLRR
jgi:hypothetical protein